MRFAAAAGASSEIYWPHSKCEAAGLLNDHKMTSGDDVAGKISAS